MHSGRADSPSTRRSPALAAEFEYWHAQRAEPLPSLPASNPEGRNLIGGTRTLRLHLTAEETTALIKHAPRVFRCEINDLLLTALAQAFCRWSGAPKLRVELESHGRADLFEDVDLSRTVGWFTSSQIVILEPVPGDLDGSVRNTRDAPARGAQRRPRLWRDEVSRRARRRARAASRAAGLLQLPRSVRCARRRPALAPPRRGAAWRRAQPGRARGGVVWRGRCGSRGTDAARPSIQRRTARTAQSQPDCSMTMPALDSRATPRPAPAGAALLAPDAVADGHRKPATARALQSRGAGSDARPPALPRQDRRRLGRGRARAGMQVAWPAGNHRRPAGEHTFLVLRTAGLQ